jgi:hypothetical protein
MQTRIGARRRTSRESRSLGRGHRTAWFALLAIALVDGQLVCPECSCNECIFNIFCVDNAGACN